MTVRVCFVCTGNICRSPMAEIILRSLAGQTPTARGTLGGRLEVSSAGTGPWHVGEPMDVRAARALADAGYPDPPRIDNLSRDRSRPLLSGTAEIFM